jgi:hypothetical protein
MQVREALKTLYRWLHGGYTAPRNEKAHRVRVG